MYAIFTANMFYVLKHSKSNSDVSFPWMITLDFRWIGKLDLHIPDYLDNFCRINLAYFHSSSGSSCCKKVFHKN